MEKRTFILLALILLQISFIQAINLNVSSEPVLNSVVKELNNPAVFKLTITNLEETNNFEIYSLVGLDIIPKDPVTIKSGETKTITIEVMPQESIKSKEGFFAFEYRIKNSKNEIQKEQLTINIIDLANVFVVTPDNINPKSEKINIELKNKINLDFNEVKINIDSAFFEYETQLSLNSLESKELIIPLDKEKTSKLNSGQYLVNIKIDTLGKEAQKDFLINFLEQEDIQTTETSEGIIKRRNEIVKKNIGNVEKTVEIHSEKNIISYLFTTLNTPPTDTKISGLKKQYTWKKELVPNEEFKVVITTNWFYPIIILILIILAIFLIKKSIETDLSLRKKVSYIKTRGGQFALKITLHIKSKKFLERIKIIDKLPHLVELYEKFGSVIPDKIDAKNRRLEWDIAALNTDEERIFTYIIYSKIGVVGRFELPSARAVYEKEGRIKETTSNRSFFINEPKHSEN